MLQTADRPLEATYDDLFDRDAKFEVTQKYTDVEGIMHLSIEIELPYRDRIDVREHLRAFIDRLDREPRLVVAPSPDGGN